jgi:hypothetical protein
MVPQRAHDTVEERYRFEQSDNRCLARGLLAGALGHLLTVASVEDAGAAYHHGRLPDGAVEFIEGCVACVASPESEAEREF